MFRSRSLVIDCPWRESLAEDDSLVQSFLRAVKVLRFFEPELHGAFALIGSVWDKDVFFGPGRIFHSKVA